MITIAAIAEIERDHRAAEALRVGHAAYQIDTTNALRAALTFLEERRTAIPEIGTVDLFGDIMTSDQWIDLRRENNEAQARVLEIARALSVDVR